VPAIQLSLAGAVGLAIGVIHPPIYLRRDGSDAFIDAVHFLDAGATDKKTSWRLFDLAKVYSFARLGMFSIVSRQHAWAYELLIGNRWY
jgi:hypothetical protein